MALPEAVEKETWGDPTWRVRDRIFAMQKGNYDGGRPSVWLKVELGGQELLVDSSAELFFVPPYVGHKGWVGIYMDVKPIPWTLQTAKKIETRARRIAEFVKMMARREKRLCTTTRDQRRTPHVVNGEKNSLLAPCSPCLGRERASAEGRESTVWILHLCTQEASQSRGPTGAIPYSPTN